MSDPQMSLSEAVLAMLAMVIVLCFVLFYYCILPCYNNYKKHNWVSHDHDFSLFLRNWKHNTLLA